MSVSPARAQTDGKAGVASPPPGEAATSTVNSIRQLTQASLELHRLRDLVNVKDTAIENLERKIKTQVKLAETDKSKYQQGLQNMMTQLEQLHKENEHLKELTGEVDNIIQSGTTHNIRAHSDPPSAKLPDIFDAASPKTEKQKKKIVPKKPPSALYKGRTSTRDLLKSRKKTGGAAVTKTTPPALSRTGSTGKREHLRATTRRKRLTASSKSSGSGDVSPRTAHRQTNSVDAASIPSSASTKSLLSMTASDKRSSAESVASSTATTTPTRLPVAPTEARSESAVLRTHVMRKSNSSNLAPTSSRAVSSSDIPPLSPALSASSISMMSFSAQLFELSRYLTSPSVSLRECIEALVQGACTVLPCDRMITYLYDDARKRMLAVSWSRLEPMELPADGNVQVRKTGSGWLAVGTCPCAAVPFLSNVLNHSRQLCLLDVPPSEADIHVRKKLHGVSQQLAAMFGKQPTQGISAVISVPVLGSGVGGHLGREPHSSPMGGEDKHTFWAHPAWSDDTESPLHRMDSISFDVSPTALDEESESVVGALVAVNYKDMNTATPQENSLDFLASLMRNARSRNLAQLATIRKDGLIKVMQDALSSSLDVRQVVRLIILNVCRLMDADRASLFILDKKSDLLVCHTISNNKSTSLVEGHVFPVTKGICGAVATTGKLLNVHDAYTHPQFNPKPDELSGYKTRSMLTVPVLDPKTGGVTAVLQAVNKRKHSNYRLFSDLPFDQDGEPVFNRLDEQSLVETAIHIASLITTSRQHALNEKKLHKQHMLMELLKRSTTQANPDDLVLDVVEEIQALLKPTRTTVYLVDSLTKELVVDISTHHAVGWRRPLYAPENSEKDAETKEIGGIVCFVARHATPLCLHGTMLRDHVGFDSKFDEALFTGVTDEDPPVSSDDGHSQRRRSMPFVHFSPTVSILAVPIVDDSGAVLGVIECLKSDADTKRAKRHTLMANKERVDYQEVWFESDVHEFTDMDMDIVLSLSNQTSIALSRSRMFAKIARNEEINDSLMHIVKSASSNKDVVTIINEIIRQTYRILPAERVTFFLVDEIRNELSCALSKDIEGFRIPISVGVVGQAATRGVIMNIPNAYDSEFFNPVVDKKTGFHTKTILAVPVKDHNNRVIAVTQIINKISEEQEVGVQFTESDANLIQAVNEEIAHVLKYNSIDAMWASLPDQEDKAKALLSLYMKPQGTVDTSANLGLPDVQRDESEDESEDEDDEDEQGGEDAHGSPKENDDDDDEEDGEYGKQRRRRSDSEVEMPPDDLSASAPSFSSDSSSDDHVISDNTKGGDENESAAAAAKKKKPTPPKKPMVFTEEDDDLTNLKYGKVSSYTNIQYSRRPNSGRMKARKPRLPGPRKRGKQRRVVNQIVSNGSGQAAHPQFKLYVELASNGALSSILRWDFEPFLVSDETLLVYCFQMFESFNIPYTFQVPRSKLRNFLEQISQHYNPNPYHNFKHAFSVLHCAFMLITSGGTDRRCGHASQFLTLADIFCTLVAAVCHDVDHPGVNNDYKINTEDPMAILYNDQAVLENHHAALAFEIMYHHSGDNNIFAQLKLSERKQLRQCVCQAILATDMAAHKDITSNLQKEQGHFLIAHSKDRQTMVNVLVHSADLSNPVLPPRLSQKWANRIVEEFFNQAILEKEANIVVTPFMVKRDPISKASLNLNFINYIVAPLWQTLHEYFPYIKKNLEYLAQNRQMWQCILDGVPFVDPNEYDE